MEERVLNDPEVYPSNEVLERVLGKSYSVYDSLSKQITEAKVGLSMEWRYYKDGKSWLCKICHKKRTVFWLSGWDQCFKITFYFTEKTKQEVSRLPIKEEIKEILSKSKSVGKLIPLTMSIKEEVQLVDILALIEYKNNLK